MISVFRISRSARGTARELHLLNLSVPHRARCGVKKDIATPKVRALMERAIGDYISFLSQTLTLAQINLIMPRPTATLVLLFRAEATMAAQSSSTERLWN